MGGIGGIEIESILTTIFSDFEKVGAGNEMIVKDLGSLTVTDARISSLIREKDAELLRLRDEITRLNKLKTTVSNEAAHNRTLQVITEENNKLKNEINSLRADRGSSELVTSYKDQIKVLNARIHELEQEKSNLSAQIINLENELKVRVSVQNFNISQRVEKSIADTNINNSEFSSPVNQYNVRSPDSKDVDIRMVDSKIESSNNRSPTYGNLTESQQSGNSREQSSTYRTGVQQVTSTFQTPASSSVSGGSSVLDSSSSLSSSNLQGANTTSTYQRSQAQGPTYQASGYQAGNSGIYQSGASSGYQAGSTSGSGVYQSGSGSGSGVYQAGSTSGTYQSSSYQPYQGNYSYQSSTMRSGATGSGSGVGQPQSGTGNSSSQYTSGTYQYRGDQK